MTTLVTPRNTLVAVLLLLLALLPVYCSVTGNYFLMSLFTRILIMAMAAVSNRWHSDRTRASPWSTPTKMSVSSP